MPKSRSPHSPGYGSGITAMAFMLAGLIAVNFLAGSIRWRHDLTERKLYTLDQSTRNILEKLERPVTITFYHSRSLAGTPAPIKAYARRVEDLLHEYQRLAGQRVKIESVDPRPDTEAEEWAMRHGINGYPIDDLGNRLFLGLSVASGDARAVIPFLDPGLEETLEYDITRRILRVSRPDKPVIGLISRLPVLGVEETPFTMGNYRRTDRQQPWLAFQELGRDFETRRIQPPFNTLDDDIQALLLVHPPEMDDASLLATDQYLLRGGAVIAFLDPLSVIEMEIQDDGQAAPFGVPEAASSLEPLTTAWGAGWNERELVVDIEAATSVHGANGQIEDNPMLLSLHENAFNPEAVFTAGLERLLLPLAGHFTITETGGLEHIPILQSSPNVMVVDPMTAQFGMHTLMRRFVPRDEPCHLAVRIQGDFSTAFPHGIKIADETGEPDAAEKEQTVEAEAEAEAGYEATAAAEPLTRQMPALTVSERPGVVLLVGNADMLGNAYTARQSPFFGPQSMRPINDNIAFLLNAVEHTAGGTDLRSMRTRGGSIRYFGRVQAMERAARVKWVDEEQRLQNELRETEQRLSELRAETDASQGIMLTEEQRREIERFREQQTRARAALRELRKTLREDIERLGLILKIINIGLMPLLVILCGTAFALTRRYKPAWSAR